MIEVWPLPALLNSGFTGGQKWVWVSSVIHPILVWNWWCFLINPHVPVPPPPHSLPVYPVLSALSFLLSHRRLAPSFLCCTFHKQIIVNTVCCWQSQTFWLACWRTFSPALERGKPLRPLQQVSWTVNWMLLAGKEMLSQAAERMIQRRMMLSLRTSPTADNYSNVSVNWLTFKKYLWQFLRV